MGNLSILALTESIFRQKSVSDRVCFSPTVCPRQGQCPRVEDQQNGIGGQEKTKKMHSYEVKFGCINIFGKASYLDRIKNVRVHFLEPPFGVSNKNPISNYEPRKN